MKLTNKKEIKKLMNNYPDTVFGEYIPTIYHLVTSKNAKEDFKNNIFTFIASVIRNNAEICNIDLLIKVQKFLNGVNNGIIKVDSASPDEIACIINYICIFHQDVYCVFDNLSGSSILSCYKVQDAIWNHKLIENKNYDEERIAYLQNVYTSIEEIPDEDGMYKCIIIESVDSNNYFHNFDITEIVEDMLQPYAINSKCYDILEDDDELKIIINEDMLISKIHKDVISVYTSFVKLHVTNIKHVNIVFVNKHDFLSGH